ncbi:MAG: flagellar basal body L-ring protein FlgH [Candidatus Marinimicrobia bacterium]|nr:flagellar basal body L-ring protein FlgH [Candidatus Neomarinimicrobiota bacterium]MCF7841131.1 flagellar basal body L-ring protein FlgH [Candidatus Neomarinimicrobiota bacterium]MCF7902390.1 flagellar basal body L-ring protein FlgH [Candidatus Neomarinimicrobiota bacterium]
MKSRSVHVLTALFLLMNSISFVSAQQFSGTYNSLYHDIKGVQVGDVVTILISESANASKSSKSNNSTSSGAAIDGSVNSNLTNFLPLFGSSGNISNSFDGRTDTQQRENLTGKVTATIVEETSSGMLRLEGSRTLEVNGEKNLISLKGYVRARDISTDNTVYSYQIANAEITYSKMGIKHKLGFAGGLQKVATWAIGLGLLAVGLGVTL